MVRINGLNLTYTYKGGIPWGEITHWSDHLWSQHFQQDIQTSKVSTLKGWNESVLPHGDQMFETAEQAAVSYGPKVAFCFWTGMAANVL